MPTGPVYQMVNLNVNGSVKKVLMALPPDVAATVKPVTESTGQTMRGTQITNQVQLGRTLLAPSPVNHGTKLVTRNNTAGTTSVHRPVKNVMPAGPRLVAPAMRQTLLVPLAGAVGPRPVAPNKSLGQVPPGRMVVGSQPMPVRPPQRLIVHIPSGKTLSSCPAGTSVSSAVRSQPQQIFMTGQKGALQGSTSLLNQGGTKLVWSTGGAIPQVTNTLVQLRPGQGMPGVNMAPQIILKTNSTSGGVPIKTATTAAAAPVLRAAVPQLSPTRMLLQLAGGAQRPVLTAGIASGTQATTSTNSRLIPVSCGGKPQVFFPASVASGAQQVLGPKTIVPLTAQASGTHVAAPATISQTCGTPQPMTVQVPAFQKKASPFKSGNFVFIPNTLPCATVPTTNPNQFGPVAVGTPGDKHTIEFKKGGQTFFMQVPVPQGGDASKPAQTVAAVKTSETVKFGTASDGNSLITDLLTDDFLSRTPIEIKPAPDDEVDSVISALQGGEASLVPLRDSDTQEQETESPGEQPVESDELDFGLKIDSVYSLSGDTAAVRWDDAVQDPEDGDGEHVISGHTDTYWSNTGTDPDMPVLHIEPASFDASEKDGTGKSCEGASTGGPLYQTSEENDDPNVIRGDCLQVRLAQQAAFQLQRQMRQDAEDREVILSEWQQKDPANPPGSSLGYLSEPPILEPQVSMASSEEPNPTNTKDTPSDSGTRDDATGRSLIATALSEQKHDEKAFDSMVDELISEYFQSPERPQRKVMLRPFSECTSDSEDQARSLVTTQAPSPVVLSKPIFQKTLPSKEPQRILMAPTHNRNVRPVVFPGKPPSSTAVPPNYVKIISKDAFGKCTTRVVQTMNTGGQGQQPVLRIIWPPGHTGVQQDQIQNMAAAVSKSVQHGLMPALPGLMTVQPGVKSAAPGLKSTQPGVKSTQPSLTHTWPGLVPFQSCLKSVQPVFKSAQPGPTSAPPGLMFVQSSVNSAGPGVKSVQLDLKPAKPGVKLGESGVKPEQPGQSDQMKGQDPFTSKESLLTQVLSESKDPEFTVTKKKKRKRKKKRKVKQIETKQCSVRLKRLFLKGKTRVNLKRVKLEFLFREPRSTRANKRKRQRENEANQGPQSKLRKGHNGEQITASNQAERKDPKAEQINSPTNQDSNDLKAERIKTAESGGIQISGNTMVAVKNTLKFANTGQPMVMSFPFGGDVPSSKVSAGWANRQTIQGNVAETTSGSGQPVTGSSFHPTRSLLRNVTVSNHLRPLAPKVIKPLPIPANSPMTSPKPAQSPATPAGKNPVLVSPKPATSSTMPAGKNVAVTSPKPVLPPVTPGGGNITPKANSSQAPASNLIHNRHKYLLIKTSMGQYLVPVNSLLRSDNLPVVSSPVGSSIPAAQVQTSGPITTGNVTHTSSPAKVSKSAPVRNVTIPANILPKTTPPLPGMVRVKEEPTDKGYDKYEYPQSKKATPATDVVIKQEPGTTEEPKDAEEEEDGPPVDHVGRIEALKARLREHEEQLKELRRQREETRLRLDSLND